MRQNPEPALYPCLEPFVIVVRRLDVIDLVKDWPVVASHKAFGLHTECSLEPKKCRMTVRAEDGFPRRYSVFESFCNFSAGKEPRRNKLLNF
jgi:hypothetical protein